MSLITNNCKILLVAEDAEDKNYDTAQESSEFFSHENNLNNHNFDNNKPSEDKPDASFFTGSESQQPTVDTYTPPQSFAPTESFIQPPEVFSTTENNAESFFAQNPASQGPFKVCFIKCVYMI